jgi:hypothetical protein
MSIYDGTLIEPTICGMCGEKIYYGSHAYMCCVFDSQSKFSTYIAFLYEHGYRLDDVRKEFKNLAARGVIRKDSRTTALKRRELRLAKISKTLEQSK